jgi:hypothetical protein
MTRETDNEAAVSLAQRRMKAMGLYAGDVDGWGGPATQAALERALAIPVTVAVPGDAAVATALPRWPRQSDVTSFYGPAGGPECTVGKVISPVPFVLSWDRAKVVRAFGCHRKIEAALNGIFRESVAHYGEARFVELGLNIFGGCFNVRKMRNSGAMSMHSWGIAVDLDPDRNQLNWGRDRAVFARPEYEAFWKIVEAKGAVSLGRVRNFDWMHFQFATL